MCLECTSLLSVSTDLASCSDADPEGVAHDKRMDGFGALAQF